MGFNDFGLPQTLVQALAQAKISNPLPIQVQAIPLLLEGSSAMLISRTGSGKTLAYLLPILASLDPAKALVQAIILAPTHELAMQIYKVATKVSQDSGLDLKVQALIGGVATKRQLEGLKKKPQLIIGSAGRIGHFLELKKLKLGPLQWLVFDEADNLLLADKLGEIQPLVRIKNKQTICVFVSATMDAQTTKVAQALAPDLQLIQVQEESINPAVSHKYILGEQRDKIDLIRKVVRGLQPKRTLVFVHRGTTAQDLVSKLKYHGLKALDLHGTRYKLARQQALEAFRQGQVQVLVASDIAARGLDIAGVDLVINYDPPSQSRDYVHRAGRTGRGTASGLVITLVTNSQRYLIKNYVRDLDIEVHWVGLKEGSLVPQDG